MPLLGDGQQVVHHIIQHQSCREEEEHDGEHQRHDFHHLCLGRVAGRRVQRGLEPHGGRHQNRQDKERVGARQVGNPAQPRRLAQFHRQENHPVQADENRHLHQHGQAAAQRVDFFVAVQLHHGLLQAHFVVAVLFFQCFHFGRDGAHFRHGAVGFVIERIQNRFHDNGQHDNRPAPVVNQAVQPVKQGEQWRGKNMHAAVVFGQLEFGRYGFQNAGDLRAGIKLRAKTLAAACGHLHGRDIHAGTVQVVAAFFHIDGAGCFFADVAAFLRLHNPCRHEIMLNHAHITAGGFALVFGGVFAGLEIVVQIAVFHFLEFVAVGRVHHGAVIAAHKPAFTLWLAVVAHHLVIRADLNRRGTRVFHVKAHIHQIAVFAEGVHFVNVHAVGRLRAQFHFQRIAR